MKHLDPINRRQFVRLGAFAGGAAILPGWSAAQDTSIAAHATLPDLGYAYDALAPHIDARTMEIHHGKHHAAYVKNFNAALDQLPGMRTQALEAMLAALPTIADEALCQTVRNNGGGHWNHAHFWKSMAPAGKTGAISDRLGVALQQTFGSVDDFKAAFSQAAATRFGSGWAWLIVRDGKLKVTSTANQDNPLMTGVVEETGTPILGLDVWEHAYYLHYQNRRADYIGAWWKVVDWGMVSQRYTAASA